MFGFQRVGDLIWAAADMRAKGFLLGGTAGRTTLNGEGLQHQDGHSLVNAMAFPTVRAYDPAYNYETAVIIFHGMKRMYVDNDTCIYYLMLENENYMMPEMPAGPDGNILPEVEEGIIKGMYKVSPAEKKRKHHVQLFGSGAILRGVLDAQKLLAEKYDISSDVWSVTSYTELRREAQECRRWNMLHPDAEPRVSFLEKQIAGLDGPFIAASDYMRALAEQIDPWVPGGIFALGTDGMGRSESREALRRHFEVDAEFVTLATIDQLKQRGADVPALAKVIEELGIDPDKQSALYA
jgi:pyruvate dehydrogenase E1 component